MTRIFFLAKKELSSYFKSPAAYIVLAAIISIFNIFFFIIIDENQEASLRDVFLAMDFILVFVTPIITMRLFSEEKLTGTMEFLMTAPLTNTAIVLGKYVGVLILFSIMISVTFIYYGILQYFANPDRLTVFTGYLGIWLEGAFFLAIGVMTSSWTRNQIVAAIASFSIIFFLYFSANLVPYFPGIAAQTIEQIGTLAHFQNFVSGRFSITDISYYLSGIVVCLMLARLSIEQRFS